MRSSFVQLLWFFFGAFIIGCGNGNIGDCPANNRMVVHWDFISQTTGAKISSASAGVSNVVLTVTPNNEPPKSYRFAADSVTNNIPMTGVTDFYGPGSYQIQFTAIDAATGSPAFNSASEVIMLPVPIKCGDVGTYDVTVQSLDGTSLPWKKSTSDKE